MGPWLIITPAWAAPAAPLVRVSVQALAAAAPFAATAATAFIVTGALTLLPGTAVGIVGAGVRRADDVGSLGGGGTGEAADDDPDRHRPGASETG